MLFTQQSCSAVSRLDLHGKYSTSMPDAASHSVQGLAQACRRLRAKRNRSMPAKLPFAVAAAALTLALLIFALIPWIAQAAAPADLTNFQNEYACNDTTTLVVRPSSVEDLQQAVKRYKVVRANGLAHSWNRPFFCSNASVTDNSTQGAPYFDTAAASGPVAVNVQLTTIRPLNITVLEDEEAVLVDAGVRLIDLMNYLGNYVTEKAPAGWTLPAFPWYVYQSIGGAVATGTHGSNIKHNSLSDQVLEMDMVTANGSLITLNPKDQPFLMRAARVSVGRLGIITRLKLRIMKEQPVKREVRTMKISTYLQLLKDLQQYYAANKTLPAEFVETEWFWQTQRSEIYMVSFIRGDVGDASVRESVLRDWQPDSTTIYDTSLALLQDSNVTRLEDLPLKRGIKYTASGLTDDAQTVTQNILANTINQPVPDFALASQGLAGEFHQIASEAHAVAEEAADCVKHEFKHTVGSDESMPATCLSVSKFSRDGAVNSSSKWLGVPWVVPPHKPINIMYGQPSSALALMDLNKAGVMLIAGNATLEASKSYLYQPETLEFQIKGVLYDQYEVSFPMATMGDCLEGMMKVVYGDDIDSVKPEDRVVDRGFRSAPLFRMVGQEDGFLAQTSDGARLFLNIEDYLYYNVPVRKTNQAFKKVVGYLRSSPACGISGLTGQGGRLHWGKAGWPDAGCWRGDVEYPATWCDFGCAVAQLDPDNKFIGAAPDRWTWRGVDLKKCCTANGFDKTIAGCQCKVDHDRSIDSCPPSPYYTYR